jgi:hypothetical protein
VALRLDEHRARAERHLALLEPGAWVQGAPPQGSLPPEEALGVLVVALTMSFNLSAILSKALLLAADDKITDPAILRQLG